MVERLRRLNHRCPPTRRSSPWSGRSWSSVESRGNPPTVAARASRGEWNREPAARGTDGMPKHQRARTESPRGRMWSWRWPVANVVGNRSEPPRAPCGERFPGEGDEPSGEGVTRMTSGNASESWDRADISGTSATTRASPSALRLGGGSRARLIHRGCVVRVAVAGCCGDGNFPAVDRGVHEFRRGADHQRGDGPAPLQHVKNRTDGSRQSRGGVRMAGLGGLQCLA